MDKIHYLTHLTKALAPYPLHSRIHKLKTFDTSTAHCYIKREDELGFGISGSKIRKYAALMPYLLQNNYKEAITVGGVYSNHVVGITQLLIENDIKPTLFLLGSANYPLQGNFLLTNLLISIEQIHWVTRQQWPQVETMAAAYAQTCPHPTKIIPCGASMPEALPGTLSLALDILQNEEQLQQEFEHIFIDAGTGLTAISLILAFAWLNKKTQVHVLLLADNEKIFIKKLQQFQTSFEQLINEKLAWSSLLEQFKLYPPTQAASFGAVNATVLQNIKTFARTEGFITDPIYSSKLLFEARKVIQENSLAGNILIIHSGGGLTLLGFQEQLAKLF